MRFRLADSLVSCEHKEADSCKKQRLEKYLDSSGRSLMRACFGVSFVCSAGADPGIFDWGMGATKLWFRKDC